MFRRARHAGLALCLFAPLVFGASTGHADDKACIRNCQRNFDDCRDECPKQGKQAKPCMTKCMATHTQCLAACH
jgi:hypothetical protein